LSALRAARRGAWSSACAEKLKEMAESFCGLHMAINSGRFREAVVRRGDRAGLIYFLEVEGEWRISEM
jgi:hypothetical protein